MIITCLFTDATFNVPTTGNVLLVGLPPTWSHETLRLFTVLTPTDAVCFFTWLQRCDLPIYTRCANDRLRTLDMTNPVEAIYLRNLHPLIASHSRRSIIGYGHLCFAISDQSWSSGGDSAERHRFLRNQSRGQGNYVCLLVSDHLLDFRT